MLPESLPENSPIWSTFNSTADGFLIIGNFNALGIAEGCVEPQIGLIKEIRLHVHSDSENWAILSEVWFALRFEHYNCFDCIMDNDFPFLSFFF